MILPEKPAVIQWNKSGIYGILKTKIRKRNTQVVTIVRDFCLGQSTAQFSVPASVNRLCGVEVVGCHH